MPPMFEPETLRRPIMRPNAETLQGLRGSADKRKSAVEGEQVDIGVDIVIGRYGIEDEIEAAGVVLHLVRIPGKNDFVGTKTKRVLLLARRSR